MISQSAEKDSNASDSSRPSQTTELLQKDSKEYFLQGTFKIMHELNQLPHKMLNVQMNQTDLSLLDAAAQMSGTAIDCPLLRELFKQSIAREKKLLSIVQKMYRKGLRRDQRLKDVKQKYNSLKSKVLKIFPVALATTKPSVFQKESNAQSQSNSLNTAITNKENDVKKPQPSQTWNETPQVIKPNSKDLQPHAR